jgi:Protein of unknown function (DUF1376)
MSDFPDPLTPADCDLRGMPYMPLDIVRLFDSDFYVLSNGDEFKAGVSLWAKAFLQVPAGSLPKDERLLAHLSGAGAGWERVKDMALRGWVECSDGRLYHPTVAEKALEAWKARLDRRARTEAARAARQAAATRSVSGNEPPPTVTDDATSPVTHNVTILPTKIATTDVTSSVTDDVTSSKGSTREGKGREDKKESKIHPPSPRKRGGDFDSAEFLTCWSLFPKRVGKGAARQAFARALKKTSAETIIAALRRQSWPVDPQYQPHPTTWLNQERWLDETGEQFDPTLRAAGLTPDDFAPTHQRPELLQ